MKNTNPVIQNIIESNEKAIAPTLSYKLRSALSYASRGWRVIPVTDKKIPLIKGWPTFASTDPNQITSWWTQYPNANVGIATGPKSGFWVIDIDVKHGVNGWDSIIREFGEPVFEDKNICVKTPSGGYHLYFQWDESFPVTVAANVIPGVDIRGETGFVMAPPSSINLDGKQSFYRFNDENNTIPVAPKWANDLALMSLQSSSSTSDRSISSTFNLKEVMTGISEGGRDNALFKYACHLRGCEVPYDLAEAFLTEAANRCNPSFDQQLVINKLQRVYSTQPQRKNIFSLKGQ